MSIASKINGIRRKAIAFQGLYRANRTMMFGQRPTSIFRLSVRQFTYQLLANSAYMKGQLTSGDYEAAQTLVDVTPANVKEMAKLAFLSKGQGYMKGSLVK